MVLETLPRRRPTDDELVQQLIDHARLYIDHPNTPADRRLVHGRTITCPSCEKDHDVLAYKPLEYVEKYADQVIPPIICPSCKHWFALRGG